MAVSGGWRQDRSASYEVHADAKGARLNIYDRGEISFKSSGHVNVGLAEPDHLALISLHQTTASLLLSTGEPTPRDLVAPMTMQQLVDDADEALDVRHSLGVVIDFNLPLRGIGHQRRARPPGLNRAARWFGAPSMPPDG